MYENPVSVGPGTRLKIASDMTESAWVPAGTIKNLKMRFEQNRVGAWRFNGNLDDSSGWNRNLLSTGVPQYAPGLIGQAILFDNTYYLYSDFGEFKTRDQFSVASWILLNDGDAVFAGRVNNQLSGWAFYSLNSEGQVRLYFRFYDATFEQGIIVSPQGRLDIGLIYHIAVTYDGRQKANGVTFYINSVRRDNVIVQDNLAIEETALGTNFQVGGYSNVPFFNGREEDLNLYDTILNQEDIDDMYNDGNGDEHNFDLDIQACLEGGESNPETIGTVTPTGMSPVDIEKKAYDKYRVKVNSYGGSPTFMRLSGR